MIGRYGQITQLVPLLTPQNIGTTATKSAFVNLGGAHRCTFIIPIGVLTATSIDQPLTVTVKAASSAASTLAVAIPFNWRLSGAVGTDTWSAIGSAQAAGLALLPTGGAAPVGASCTLIIDVDPAIVRAAVVSLTGKYAYVTLTPDAGMTATNVAVLAELEPRYIQTSPVSSS
jgi:hypothetical protein